MKKFIALAFIAYSFAQLSVVEASPPEPQNTHQTIVNDLNYDVATPVVLYNYQTNIDSVYVVSVDSFIDNAPHCSIGISTQNNFSTTATHQFKGYVIKPPLCGSNSYSNYAYQPKIRDTGIPWCYISNTLKFRF